MKKENFVILLIVFITLAFTVSSCKEDEPIAAQTSYVLAVKDVLGVSGTATFIETSNTTTTINIVLNGAPSGTHPAELSIGSAIENGNAAYVLNPVDGTGKSSTVVNSSYKELIEYDGSIKVSESSLEPTIILAIGDIGGNVMTTTKKSYTLQKVGLYGVSGTALFEKRTNGNTLLTIKLTGTISGELYPATINIGSISTVGGGDVKKTLNGVNGSTGESYTNIRTLDSNTPIKYEDWLEYVGYINIYQATPSILNIICQGDIGKNVAL
jgi:hypothetical protein